MLIRKKATGETLDVTERIARRALSTGRYEPAEAAEEEVDVSAYHKGGGWYEVDGETMRRDDAEALLNG